MAIELDQLMGHNLPWQQSSTKEGVNYFKLNDNN